MAKSSRPAVRSVFALSTAILAIVASLAIAHAAPAPAVPANPGAELKRLTAEIASHDAERVKAAVPQIRDLIAKNKKTSYIVADSVRQLMYAKSYEGIDELAVEYALMYPTQCDWMLKQRVAALLGLGKKQEALAAAKVYYNVAALDQTMDAISTVSQALLAARPDDEELLSYSCLWAAGEQGKDGIFSKIWADLAARNHTNYYYYLTENPNVFSARALIVSGEGRCGAWEDFMISLNKCHGISPTSFGVEPTPGGGAQATKRFFVKHLTHIAGQPMTSAAANMSGLPEAPNSEWPVVAPNVGLPGQTHMGQAHPTPHKKRFVDHALVKYTMNGTSKLYDPSYGDEYGGANDNACMLEFEDGAIAFYGTADLGGSVFTIQDNTANTLECQQK